MYAARRGSAKGTATTADAVSCEPTATTGVLAAWPVASATGGSSGPSTSPGSRRAGRIPTGTSTRSASPVAQVRVRTSYSWVVEAFVCSAATCPVSQCPSRSGRSSIVATSSSGGLRGELVDRVERQLLDAGGGVELLGRDPPAHLLEDSVGAGVAVAVRVAEQRPGRVEEAVVDRPGVDADRVDRSGCLQPGEDLPVQAADVPVQAAVVRRAPVRSGTGAPPRGRGRPARRCRP